MIKTVEDKNKPSIYSPTAWKNWLVSYLYHPVEDTPIETQEVFSGPTDPETAISSPVILETFRKIEKVLETYGEELQQEVNNLGEVLITMKDGTKVNIVIDLRQG